MPPSTAVWSSCSRRDRFDRFGTAAFMRRWPAERISFAARGVSDPFHSPTNGPATAIRRRCGTER
jgi:hypothetical protein